jgi:hypothetical protein
MTDELPEVEAPNGPVAHGKSRLVGLHAALAELAALFGMADEGFDARPTVHQTAVGGPVTLGKACQVEP